MSRGASHQSARVYDVALPGDAELDLYSGRLAGETLRQAEAALESVAAAENIEDAVLFVQYPFWSLSRGACATVTAGGSSTTAWTSTPASAPTGPGPPRTSAA